LPYASAAKADLGKGKVFCTDSASIEELDGEILVAGQALVGMLFETRSSTPKMKNTRDA
jgi:hypothetical protein